MNNYIILSVLSFTLISILMIISFKIRRDKKIQKVLSKKVIYKVEAKK